MSPPLRKAYFKNVAPKENQPATPPADDNNNNNNNNLNRAGPRSNAPEQLIRYGAPLTPMKHTLDLLTFCSVDNSGLRIFTHG